MFLQFVLQRDVGEVPVRILDTICLAISQG